MRSRCGRALQLCALVVVLFLTARAHAGDGDQKWQTIDTPHFHIHYYDLPDGRGEEALAQRLATVAEDAYRRLVPYLGPGSKRATHVVLADVTDDYNGFANVYPYPAINLRATSPDDRAELNDYDDWLSGLFLHEYTHILHLGTIGGPCALTVNALLGWGLGLVMSPNSYQPRFLLEGLAVFEESERTSGGRLRNSIWDMYLRAATLEKRFERIDQFSHVPIQFPQGNSYYLYGSAFTRFIATTYGQGALQRMSYGYGHSCIPGAINRTIRHVTGKTWIELYGDFHAAMEKRYQAQSKSIVSRGLWPADESATRLTGPRFNVGRPAFLPDGQILFLDDDGYQRQRIARLDPATKKMTTELETDDAGGISVTPDGRWLVFHEADLWRTNYFFNDLYLFDRTTHKKTRLTYGVRATNPAISPDGRRVVFEVNDRGARGLGLIRLSECDVGRDGCPVTMLIPARNFEQTYTPAWSPDGREIAFSWWRKGGYRDLYTMEVATGATKELTHDRSLDLEPRYSPDGKYRYFVSDRTEVYNLYRYDRATATATATATAGRIERVTNVLNGVFDPALSSDGRVALVGFAADGYLLEVTPLPTTPLAEADPALLDRSRSESPPDEPPRKPHSYNPFPTVLPWVFSPYAAPDGYGELLGFNLSGADATGRHSWSTLLAFDTGRANDILFAANYGFSGWWPSFNLGVGHSLDKTGLVVDGQSQTYDRESWTLGASITLPLVARLVDNMSLTLSYSTAFFRSLTPVPTQDPSAPITTRPDTTRQAGVGMAWSFQNTRRFLYSISPETGRYLSLSLGISARPLGATYDTFYASWLWEEFVRIPWPLRALRNHVLAISYTGGITGGDAAHRGAFAIGGYPAQNLLKSIYDFSRPGSATLRGFGFESLVGQQFHALNVEYRFPIVWIEHGYQTFPLYLQRLHGRVFADYGGAFDGTFSFDKLHLGLGAEAIVELTYAWYYPAALQFGYAHGFGTVGGTQYYVLLNNPF